nr:hypothetical protein Q903MT_gene2606 [Picea sitchensis]
MILPNERIHSYKRSNPGGISSYLRRSLIELKVASTEFCMTTHCGRQASQANISLGPYFPFVVPRDFTMSRPTFHSQYCVL